MIFNIRYHFKKTYFILFFILLNCQLQEPAKNHGILFLENRASQLTIMKTNKNDVVKILGQPHTTTYNENDIWIMMAFGVLGFFMEKHNFSTAGVLLGLILGPIAEDGLRNLLTISDDSPISFMMGRPVSLIIIAAIAIIMSFPIIRKFKA